MTQEALKLALEALEVCEQHGYIPVRLTRESITAIKEALAQPEQCQCPNCKVTLHASDCAVHSEPAYPKGACNCGAQPEQEFFTHCVDQPYDWSEWVCPDPKGYLMKCCDCGLVHEAEFGVVRYKSETEREDCDMVDDPQLQAVFRMRRSEQWSPEDTAHRAGGLSMAQPAQVPVTDNTYGYAKSLAEAIFKQHFASDEHYASGRIVWGVNDTVIGILTQIDNMVSDMVRRPEQESFEYWNAVEGWVKIDELRQHFGSVGCGTIYKTAGEDRVPLYNTSPQRKPLTDEQLDKAGMKLALLIVNVEKS
jgi:hypothetical protein